MTEATGKIARRLEALIHELFPDAVRSQDKSDIGFGFSRGYKGLVFVISPQRSHVNLGIAHGAELERSFPLLQGRGRVHRHVKITSLEALADPRLSRLLKTALKVARARHKVPP
jgi:hypothetical protein